ncbi:MAG: bacterial transcriptional activator domain-containing protein [Lachnospiraceae bacterium]|nr:bacterial transcriptional activator domain-containing protein [Lachnospiraceae bacterium]
MKNRPYTQFYASLLGGFSLSFGDENLQVNGNLQSKTMQIMLALLKSGSQGMARSRLMQIVWGEGGDPEKAVSNLNQQIYLLRKRIESWSFPPGKYIVQQNGTYYFSLEYEVETDTARLDELLRQIRDGTKDAEEECRLLREICHAYTGEFLPMLSGEEWVTLESAYYQSQYFNALSRLCDILKKKGAYEEMLELCTAASQMHPYDEWQAVQIDCLMSMNRYKEALKVYEEATETFYEDIGLTSIDRVMAKYRNQSGQMYYAAGALSSIKEGLGEEITEREAYCCSYPGFVDLYRALARMGTRSSQKHFLMLCTRKGENLENVDHTAEEEKRMEQFRRFLVTNIRLGDVYTRYSPNQFLVLLTDAEPECEDAIVRRLREKWKQMNRNGKTEIEFLIQKVEGPES